MKTAEPIEMPFWRMSQVDPRNHILDGVQISQGEVAVVGRCPPHSKALGVFAVVYAKTAVPIQMPFGANLCGCREACIRWGRGRTIHSPSRELIKRRCGLSSKNSLTTCYISWCWQCSVSEQDVHKNANSTKKLLNATHCATRCASLLVISFISRSSSGQYNFIRHAATENSLKQWMVTLQQLLK